MQNNEAPLNVHSSFGEQELLRPSTYPSRQRRSRVLPSSLALIVPQTEPPGRGCLRSGRTSGEDTRCSRQGYREHHQQQRYARPLAVTAPDELRQNSDRAHLALEYERDRQPVQTDRRAARLQNPLPVEKLVAGVVGLLHVCPAVDQRQRNQDDCQRSKRPSPHHPVPYMRVVRKKYFVPPDLLP